MEPVRMAGGAVLFVHLACDREELLTGVQNDARQTHSKLTDPKGFVDLSDLNATLQSEPHLRVDTTRMPPAEAAVVIAKHFGLPSFEPD